MSDRNDSAGGEGGPQGTFTCLEAHGGGNVPDAHGAIQRGGQQPPGIRAHVEVCDSIAVSPKLAHAPHCLNIIPAQRQCQFWSCCLIIVCTQIVWK